MKLDKKVYLILGVILVVAILGICWMLTKNNNPNETKVVVKPLNEKVNLTEVFNEIELIDGMKSFDEMDNVSVETENEVDDGENDILPEEEIDFGKYNELEKKAIVNTTDDNVNEVWMIKLGSYEQQEDVCRILGNRLKKLKAGFEEDNENRAVLEDAVIKQEDGIVIMIISPYYKEIQETIAEAM